MEWYGLDWCGSGWGLVDGSCEHGNKSSGSIKYRELLEWLHNWRFLKNGSALWVSEWEIWNEVVVCFQIHTPGVTVWTRIILRYLLCDFRSTNCDHSQFYSHVKFLPKTKIPVLHATRSCLQCYDISNIGDIPAPVPAGVRAAPQNKGHISRVT
jgi:hypothetical protein